MIEDKSEYYQGINRSLSIPVSALALRENRDGVTDEDLIVLILNNSDKQAYNALVQRYLRKIWRLAFSVLKNEEEAEDAVQDVFLSLLKSLEKFDIEGGAKFSTWIYRVSLNKCIDLKRKRKPMEHAAPSDDLVSEEKSAYHATLNHQVSKRLKDLMQSLPTGQKDALKMYYYEEKSVQEICNALSKSEDSIRSLLKRGKAELKEKMQPSRQSWL